MLHEHVSCPPAEWLWLPYDLGSDYGFLKQHPFCVDCGAVRNMGPDRARGIGYYANVLGAIARREKLADVQIRLIMKELERIEDFEDTYTLSGEIQREWFLDAVERYTSLSRDIVKEYL